jgi:hypothetical protein
MPVGQKRQPYPLNDMEPLFVWLTGRHCPVCREALDNGTALIVIPGSLVRHVACVRPPVTHPPPRRTV